MDGLIREVSREEQGELLAKRLFQWDLAVRQFRKTETKRITLGNPTAADLESHALCLHGLLAIGHALVLRSKEVSPDELARFGIRPEEIETYVEELEQSFREWHHHFSEEDLQKVRRGIFGGEA